MYQKKRKNKMDFSLNYDTDVFLMSQKEENCPHICERLIF